MHGKLVAKVNNIDASGFVSNTKYDTDKSDLSKTMIQTKEYLILVNLLKKSDYNIKISQIKNKIPSISDLATNSTLKTDFDTKLKRLNRKVNSNKRKHSLVENELIKLQTFDSGVLDIKVILKEMMLKIN